MAEHPEEVVNKEFNGPLNCSQEFLSHHYLTVELLTIESCRGLGSEPQMQWAKILIFTSPVSCLRSIFHSPGFAQAIPVGVDRV